MANQIKVGNVEIRFVLDMLPPPRDPTVMFPTTTAQDWEPYHDALEDCQLQLYYGHFYLRSQGQTIMVDTGMGPGPHPSRDNRTGDMLNQLKISGVNPEDVDIVVMTHLHIDHVGWNLDYTSGGPTPYFPNARYLAPRLAWAHFLNPEFAPNAPCVRPPGGGGADDPGSVARKDRPEGEKSIRPGAEGVTLPPGFDDFPTGPGFDEIALPDAALFDQVAAAIQSLIDLEGTLRRIGQPEGGRGGEQIAGVLEAVFRHRHAVSAAHPAERSFAAAQRQGDGVVEDMGGLFRVERLARLRL